MTPARTFAASSLPLLLTLLASCSEGGSTKTSDVKLAATHHGVGFGGTYRLTTWPIDASVILDDLFTLTMKDDGNYSVQRTGQTPSSPLPYYLTKDGTLGLRISSSSSNTVVWDGAYAIDNPAHEYGFVRRDGLPTFYAGVEKINGEPQLTGAWWAFGTELHFGDAKDDPSSDTIGRAFAGELNFDANKNLANSNWTDSSTDTGRLVLVSGQAKAFTDGELQLTTVIAGGPATGARSFEGGVGKHFGALVSRSPSEPAQSLLLLVRKHTAAWTLADLAGEWHVSTQTIFNEPAKDAQGKLTRAGLDAALGRLTIEPDGDVRIRVRGISNQDFVYTGTVRLGTEGGFEIEIIGQARRWTAAMDPDRRVLVLADHVTRASDKDLDYEVGVWFALPLQGQTGS